MAEGEERRHDATHQDACSINNGTVNNYYGHDGRDRDYDRRRPRRRHLRRLIVVGAATSAAASMISVSAVGLSAVGHVTPHNPTPAPTPAPIVNPAPTPVTPPPVCGSLPTGDIGNRGQQAILNPIPVLSAPPQMQPDGTMQLTESFRDAAPNGDANVCFRIYETKGKVHVPVIADQSTISCTGCTVDSGQPVFDGKHQIMEFGSLPNGGEVDFLITWRPSTARGHAQLQVLANGNPKWKCLGNINEVRSGPGA